MLPHAYPFRFVSDAGERGGGGLSVVLSSGDGVARGLEGRSSMLAIEIMAQASMALLSPGSPADGVGRGLLAGVDQASFPRPLVAGAKLGVGARISRRLGRLVKVEAWLDDADGRVASAGLLLAFDG